MVNSFICIYEDAGENSGGSVEVPAVEEVESSGEVLSQFRIPNGSCVRAQRPLSYQTQVVVIEVGCFRGTHNSTRFRELSRPRLAVR